MEMPRPKTVMLVALSGKKDENPQGTAVHPGHHLPPHRSGPALPWGGTGGGSRAVSFLLAYWLVSRGRVTDRRHREKKRGSESGKREEEEGSETGVRNG